MKEYLLTVAVDEDHAKYQRTYHSRVDEVMLSDSVVMLARYNGEYVTAKRHARSLNAAELLKTLGLKPIADVVVALSSTWGRQTKGELAEIFPTTKPNPDPRPKSAQPKAASEAPPWAYKPK